MFGKKSKNPPDTIAQPEKDNTPRTPRFVHPKILLIDLKDDSAAVLAKDGFSVSSGSFGIPYKVPKSDKSVPVVINGELPDFAEQEIVVVDLLPNKPLTEPAGEKHTSPGEDDWWCSCKDGIIDPRPRRMVAVQDYADRILSHGGVFVIFADSHQSQKMCFGHIERGYGLASSEDIPYDNWSFLSSLGPHYLEIIADRGKEIATCDAETPLAPLFKEHLSDAHFLCTFRSYHPESVWRPLLRNKYDNTVGGAIVANNGDGRPAGWVLIFPQIRDKASFLEGLVKSILPDLAPHLFPDVEGARWVERPEYELPKVLELQRRIAEIQAEAKRQTADLQSVIEDERLAGSYLYDLIRATGVPLVKATKKALEVIGFQNVVDVDEEKEKAGDKGPKREDLQVWNASPLLLIEVKGITNLPKEAATLQVWKYLAPRMKELGRLDVAGLSILNHQRNLPALERENQTTFSDDVLTNAQEHKFGLLTTWDLFRLTRSFLKNGWQHEHVHELFYRAGRIEPIPTHYQFVGVVENFWEKPGVVGIRIRANDLTIGGRVAFELPVEMEEQEVESLQVERTPVEKARVGELAGVKTRLSKEQAKKGTRVYRIVEFAIAADSVE